MSNPAPTLPDTPQEALGIPDNPLGRFPTLAGRNGSRRRSRGPGGGLPKNPLGRDVPHTPGTLSPSERRAQAKQRWTVVRPESKPEKPAPPADRPRTAAGAPVDRPRQVPKTGRTERYRDAMNTVLGKESQQWYHGQPASNQDIFNKIMRSHGTHERRQANEATRLYLQDRLNELRGVKNKPSEDEETRRNREAINRQAMERNDNEERPAGQ